LIAGYREPLLSELIPRWAIPAFRGFVFRGQQREFMGVIDMASGEGTVFQIRFPLGGNRVRLLPPAEPTEEEKA